MSTSSLFIEPFVDAGLGNSAYLVGSHASKRAVLIDPLRDVDRYQRAAEQMGVVITHVLDTHLHNDFVSGARELAAQTGAVIGVGAQFGVEFEHHALAEGDEVSLGEGAIHVLATPGHTPEHIAFVLQKNGAPEALFSGGALMVGGAARTDLLGHDQAAPLARALYHTLHDKILPLADSVCVYPTHGAGSFCAAPVSDERTTTIGQERRHNALIAAQSEDEFVARALSGLPSYPVYYPHVRAANKRGPRVLGNGGVPVLSPLSAEDVHGHVERGVLILDVRRPPAVAEAHIPGAYTIKVDAPLTTWAGWLIPFGAPLILVAENASERVNAVRQLVRIGYDNLLGYLKGGLEAWTEAGLRTETVPTITAKELRERLNDGDGPTVLDVRQDSEWRAGHIPGAVHIENGRLPYDELPFAKTQPIAVQCAHGSRSMAAISILLRRGYRNVMQVKGGLTAWLAAGYAVTQA
jgi:hydroxyacylglutathione hydrolase